MVEAMTKSLWRIALLPLALVGAAAAPASRPAGPITVTPVDASSTAAAALPLHIGGRVERTAEGYRRQWPGTYWEGAFLGNDVQMRIGAGDVILKVAVDGMAVATLVKPRAGAYAISGLTSGRHVVRVDVASESQAGPTDFGGLFVTGSTRPLPAPTRARQIEFIGDSHTVGYGNTSTTRECSEAQVWHTTDTSRGIAALTAGRYDADYRVNAISGRGIVRNYDGFAADTIPEAYPFVLFDKARRSADPAWRPQVIVVALGTNDFSTPLHAGEPWRTRAALHAAYQTTYARFVRRLRAAHPRAHILLWATDLAAGEIAAQAGEVAAKLRAAGDRRIAFLRISDLAMSGCHAHPSLADDRVIAERLAAYIDGHPDIWPLTKAADSRR